MRRTALLAAAAATAAAALALAGCPLPQPLAEVARSVDGGSVSTPVILPETALPAATIVLVRPNCAQQPQFVLSAKVEDLDTDETVLARWFLDWRNDNPGPLLLDDNVPASGDPNDPTRLVTPLGYQPYQLGAAPPPAGAVHVVDLVVSNGFRPQPDLTPPRLRSALPPFVAQSYRWVFQYDAAGFCQCDALGNCQ